ncbi:MAG: COX15/CtaA family protein, partial [Proteobacteria bacterium]|nr:COX15/CtaA family protein [Pseudomonadota bacterium]
MSQAATFGIASADDRKVVRWLLLLCAMVFAMVVLGGLTRLTGSGLSMVDWRPLMGVLPPLTDAEWQRVFEMYRQTPEFRQVNSGFDVADFKGIFWLEYLHRLLGRAIGIVFLLPFVYFVARGYIRQSDW